MPQGLALDAILVSAVNPGAGGIVGTVTPSGDPLSIRNFGSGGSAYLENIIRMGTGAGFVQVQSPLLHDNVQGIRITPSESPSLFSLPAEQSQTLQAQDTLQVTISGGASETDIAILTVYYTNLTGAAARLFSPGDINGNIKYIKPIRVAVTSSATIGTWVDTIITTTENLLHANKDYAVLGYMDSAAFGAIGVKGADTSNFRAVGPGSTQEIGTTDFFMAMSTLTGRPHVPVFNSANANGTFVSVCAATASVAGVVELICAELVTNLGA